MSLWREQIMNNHSEKINEEDDNDNDNEDDDNEDDDNDNKYYY